MYKVLFVCTGNICRSPTAEGVLKVKLNASRLADKVYVDSAGTHGYHAGEPPDSRSMEVAAAYGYPIHGQISRRFTKDDYNKFDLILAMDKSHLEFIRPGLFDSPKAHVALFLDYVGMGRNNVPDPYYKDARAFEDVLKLIEQGADKLIEKLLITLK